MKQPREPRVTINEEFSDLSQLVSEYGANISRSGVFVRSNKPLPVGSRVNLKLTVIVDDMETIEGVGEVVRVSHEPPGMGVVFVELTPLSQQLIEKLLARKP